MTLLEDYRLKCCLNLCRNRRMFGSLLGTLAKFRQEESHLKDKEDKRAKIEQRLDENARQEKESLRKERHNLFLERRRQQAHVRRLEWKMHRLREVSFLARYLSLRKKL